MRLSTVAIFLGLAAGALAASISSNSTDSSSTYTDPIDNFCQRLWHQSVVKNDTLYIDGGLEVFIPYNQRGNGIGTPILGYNEYLITVDMDSSWDWYTNISETAYNKSANPNTGTSPPSNVRGALYAGAEDDPNLYQYGGTVSWANTSFPGFKWPTSATYALWSVDTSENSWNQYDVSLDLPYRPAGGAWAEATDRGLGFYLNGFIDNGSSSSFLDFPNFRRYLDGLVVINTTSQEAHNLSTTSLENYPRAMGGLAYIANLGSEGIIVSMGGVTKPSSNSDLSDLGTYVSFDSIDFLDIASINGGASNGTWYTQATTGSIPDPRIDFCVIAVSAPDNSSHSIYLYGGRGAKQVYDQTYVLTIPSFKWIKILEGESPRYGHTCHVVAESQMLTVGGVQYDNLTNGCDWEYKSVAILDLKTSKWGEVFNKDAGQYELPSSIYNVIGGSATGNATVTRPSAGFSSEKIAAFFDQPGTTVENTTNHKSSQLNGGDIAGIVIGSVAGAFIFAIILAVFIIRRRKKQLALATGQVYTTPTLSELLGDVPLFGRVFLRRRNAKPVELPTGSELGHELDGRMMPVELPADPIEEKKSSAGPDDALDE